MQIKSIIFANGMVGTPTDEQSKRINKILSGEAEQSVAVERKPRVHKIHRRYKGRAPWTEEDKARIITILKMFDWSVVQAKRALKEFAKEQGRRFDTVEVRAYILRKEQKAQVAVEPAKVQ